MKEGKGRRSPKEASPPGSDDDDRRRTVDAVALPMPCPALPARLAGVAGTPKKKAEGEMKPTRTGGGSNARLSCNASRDKLECALIHRQHLRSRSCTLLCSASSAQPGVEQQ